MPHTGNISKGSHNALASVFLQTIKFFCRYYWKTQILFHKGLAVCFFPLVWDIKMGYSCSEITKDY